MKIFTPIRTFALIVGLSLIPQLLLAGDGTQSNPYTVAELNAQKDALATSGATVWVKASLKGFGEDGTKTDNFDTEDAQGKTVHPMAALFEDATGTFVAYSYQILNGIALTDFTNKNDLLISLTYGTTGHPHGNSTSPQYATDYEKDVLTDNHFSLEEVHGALSVTVSNGLRGFHFPASYIVPKDIVATRVNFNYNQTSGASINYGYYDGAEEGKTYIITKGTALIWLAYDGTYDVTLSAGYYEQINSNGLNGGTQAGVNAGTTADRWRFRFVSDGTKLGFERNSDDNCTVILDSKEEVYLQVNSRENHFGGHYAWETADKKWISWGGKKITDYHAIDNTTSTFDFANNNMNLPVGTADDINAGNLGGKSIAINGVTLAFVNSMTMPTRYYKNGERGNQFQGIAGSQMRVTAPAGFAVTSIVSKGNPGKNATTGETTYQINWEVLKGGGSLPIASDGAQTWTGNAESVLLNSKGATYLNEIIVTVAEVNAETALLVNETPDTYTEVSGLAAFAETANHTLVKLTLTDAIVTSGMTNGWGYYVQDATAGAHFYCTGLDFNIGDVLNGVIYVKKNNQTMGPRICMTEVTNAESLSITAGTLTYIEGNVEAINKDANRCRLVKLAGVQVKGTSETAATITDANGKTIAINNGTTNYFPYVIQTSLAEIDYTQATVTGILFGSSSGNQIMPLTIVDNSTGIEKISAESARPLVIYNLQGQRLSTLQKGLNIVNGKKILVK